MKISAFNIYKNLRGIAKFSLACVLGTNICISDQLATHSSKTTPVVNYVHAYMREHNNTEIILTLGVHIVIVLSSQIIRGCRKAFSIDTGTCSPLERVVLIGI